MTVQPNKPAEPACPAPAAAVPATTGPATTGPATTGPATIERPPDGVTVTIDGFEITVPKGTLVIRAAELLGIQIPRFCDHPLLDPVGACRQCLVHIEGQPKPPARAPPPAPRAWWCTPS